MRSRPTAPQIGEALGGWRLEGWWAGEANGARRRDRLVGRLGIPLHGLDADLLPRATVESMDARLWSLAAGARSSEPPADPAPAPCPAGAAEPVTVACDPAVRERLRFLLWMRRLQTAPAPARASTSGDGRPVNRGRMLLVDVIDAAGAEIADVEARASLLRSAGAAVHTVAVVPEGHEPPADAATATLSEIRTDRQGVPARVRERAIAFAPDRLVIAGSDAAGGGAIARALAGAVPVHHWPTGWASRPGWREALRFPRRRVPGLFAIAGRAADTGVDPVDDVLAGCACTIAIGPAAGSVSGMATTCWRRRRSPRVPGRVFSMPSPPSRRTATGSISSSSPSRTRDWSPRPRPSASAIAFTSPAARRARPKWAWWAQASAAVLAGEGAVTGGLVLRGLISGCPLVAAAPSGPAARIGAWLVREGCAPWNTRADELSATLERVLERGPSVDDAVTRGRAIAARFDDAALLARLAAVLSARPGSVSKREAA